MLLRPQRFPELWNPRGQPQGAVAVDRAKYAALKHVIWPRAYACLVTNRQIETNSASPTRRISGGGFACVPNGSYHSIQTTLPPAQGWTYEVLVSMTNTSTSDIARHDASRFGSGTWDRAIQRIATGFRGYIYDGGAKYAEKTVTINTGQVYHVTITCTASLLTCYVNGEAGTGTVVANSGFGLGANPFVLLGPSNNSEIFFAAVWHRPLSAEEVAFRAADPYGLLIPVASMARRSIWSLYGVSGGGGGGGGGLVARRRPMIFS